jgi:H+/gluconate symporter-like permease
MQDIHPAKPVINIFELTVLQQAVLYGLIVTIMIIILFKLLNWIKNKYFSHKPQTKAEPIPPLKIDEHPEQTALKQLKKIKKFIEENKLKLFYLELTKIIKNYFQEKFITPTVQLTQANSINRHLNEYTTEEIKQSDSLKKIFTEDNHNFLINFLIQIDSIKFSDSHTDHETAKQYYQKLYSFLEKQL